MKKTIVLGLILVATSFLFAGCINLPLPMESEEESQAETISEEEKLLNEAKGKIEEGRALLFGFNDTEVDYEKAMNCFVEAAEVVDSIFFRPEGTEDVLADAYYHIGHMYNYGYGVPLDYEQGFEYISDAAMYGNAKACYELGDMWYYGVCVQKHVEYAEEHYQEAIELGYVEAYRGYGQMAYDEGDYTKALEYWTKVVNEGTEQDVVAAAMLDLVDLYAKVEELQDYSAAMEWCRKAVELEYPAAYNKMGLLYRQGKVVEQDYAKAMEWYEKAIASEYPAAYYNLGHCYIYGYGVEYDPHRAAMYYEEAANRGYESAMYQLGIMYCGETVVKGEKIYIRTYNNFETDYAKSKVWLEKAAALNNAGAMMHLGEIYTQGLSVEQNIEEGLAWYRKAAANGNTIAMLQAGRYYAALKDEFNAYRYYKQAAEAGNVIGAYELACFCNDKSVGYYDTYEAWKWATLAQELGHSKAAELVKALEKQMN